MGRSDNLTRVRMGKWTSSARVNARQYQVVGRRLPSESNPTPTVFRIKLFAKNEVVAKSRFWYYLKRQKNLKRANGEILQVNELFEKKPHQVKNYGLWIRYDSTKGTHNMYKEFRSLTLCDAVDQMYTELASRHRCPPSRIHVVKDAVVPAKECKRVHITQMHNSKIKFPLPHR